MIASINRQPDIKIFLSEHELDALKNGETINGQSWSHIQDSILELALKVDSTLQEPIRSDDWTSINISDKNLQDISENGAIFGLRFLGTPKLNIIIRERIKTLNIGVDTKEQIQWALDSLEGNLSST